MWGERQEAEGDVKSRQSGSGGEDAAIGAIAAIAAAAGKAKGKAQSRRASAPADSRGDRDVSRRASAKAAVNAEAEKVRTAENTKAKKPAAKAESTPARKPDDLSSLTVAQLKERAQKEGHTGYSRCTKAQLVDLLSR